MRASSVSSPSTRPSTTIENVQQDDLVLDVPKHSTGNARRRSKKPLSHRYELNDRFWLPSGRMPGKRVKVASAASSPLVRNRCLSISMGLDRSRLKFAT